MHANVLISKCSIIKVGTSRGIWELTVWNLVENKAEPKAERAQEALLRLDGTSWKGSSLHSPVSLKRVGQ